MGGRRRSRSELPHAPLTLVHPLSVPGAQVDGAPLLEELPRALAMPALQLLRAVLAWSRDPAETAAALDSAAVGALERRLLDRPRPEAPWTPLAVLAGAMADPLTARPDQVSLACLAVSDWAIDAGHEHTALAYAEAAALAWPANARYAWVAGRMMRSHGRMKEAERWLRRAHRVAVWTDDWETQARSLNSLGTLSYAAGNLQKADVRLDRALVVARRRGLRTLEGEILHDLFVIAFMRRDFELAETYGGMAFEMYQPGHHRLAPLAYDVAYLWLLRGSHDHAIRILTALLSHFTTADDQLQVLSAIVRAAGESGNRQLYRETLPTAWRTVERTVHGRKLGACLVDIGLGAMALEDWTSATTALERGLAEAQSHGEGDVVFAAETALAKIRNGAAISTDLTRRVALNGDAGSLADRMVRNLNNASPEPAGV